MTVRTRLLGFLVAVTAGALVVACDPGEAPAAPSVDALDELTSQNPITVTGTAEADALVEIRGGAGGVAEGTAGGDGSFSIDVMLNEDADNTLLVSQTVGGLESEAAMVMVTHDGTAPNAPEVDAVITPTRRTSQTIRGTTEANASVRIAGGAEEATGEADDMGRFEILVMLQDDDAMAVDNELDVFATDAAGNESDPTSVTITFDPTLPIEAPVLDDFPEFTNAATVTLTGEAEAGAEISAAGGATDGSATVGDDGTFSVEVGLRPNQRNEIRVFAQLTGELSPPATAVIVHDDIAPAAPNVDPEASPTGAELVRLTGLSEPMATIDVSGGAADASGTADVDGAFSVDVMLTVDSVNSLSVTASDAAGNVSDAVVLDIEQDSTLEAPIEVDPVTSPTADATVTLTGTATPEIDIEITGGDATVNTASDTSGAWTAAVDLRTNERNELHITRPGSGVDTIVVIVHDDTPPDPPALNDVPSPTSNTTVIVSGTTEARANVSISGGVSSVSDAAALDGRFSIDVMIPEDAETTLSVIATDRAGNSSSPSMVTVTHDSTVPDAPNVDDTNPPPTNMPTHEVTGEVTNPGPGITIEIAGGAAVATGPTDETTGRFAVEVTLNANAVNDLSVVSVEGAIESPPALVTITHDDIAPTAPDGSLISASSSCPLGARLGGTTAGMAGSVESSSMVRVQNLTSGATPPMPVMATPGGSFSIGVNACSGDAIEVRAEDAAGNVSDPTEVTAS